MKTEWKYTFVNDLPYWTSSTLSTRTKKNQKKKIIEKKLKFFSLKIEIRKLDVFLMFFRWISRSSREQILMRRSPSMLEFKLTLNERRLVNWSAKSIQRCVAETSQPSNALPGKNISLSRSFCIWVQARAHTNCCSFVVLSRLVLFTVRNARAISCMCNLSIEQRYSPPVLFVAHSANFTITTEWWKIESFYAFNEVSFFLSQLTKVTVAIWNFEVVFAIYRALRYRYDRVTSRCRSQQFNGDCQPITRTSHCHENQINAPGHCEFAMN